MDLHDILHITLYCIVFIMLVTILYFAKNNVKFRNDYDLALKRLKKEVTIKNNHIYTTLGLPNLNYLLSKKKKFSDGHKVTYYSLNVVCVGRSSDYYNYFDEQSAKKIKHELHTKLTMTFPNTLICLFEEKHIVILKCANEPIKQKELIDFQQKLSETLPLYIKVSTKKLPVQYAITTLNYSSRMPFSEEGKLLRRVTFGLQTAIKSESGIYTFSETHYQSFLRKRNILENLVTDIKQGSCQFSLREQPIFSSMNTNVPYISELLISWNRKGAPGPSVFMPMLESEPHLHFEMTKLVISKSVKYIKSKKPLVFYSINISPTDLSRTDFVKYFCGITSDCSWVRELIIFEVTEGERLTIDNQALDNINQLKSLGCKLAIDDFGSGYANFELLTGDLFSIVKLDKKFLSDSSLLNIGYQVIKALTRIVEDKDMKLVIEGVDNMDKIKYLKPNYRIYYQGFALAEPKEVLPKLGFYQ